MRQEEIKMENIDNTQELIDNVSRELETLRNKQEKILENIFKLTEMENSFDGLSSGFSMVKKNICEVEYRSIQSHKLQKKENK